MSLIRHDELRAELASHGADTAAGYDIGRIRPPWEALFARLAAAKR